MSRLGVGSAAGTKGTHYNANLGSALVRGAWTETNPGATPGGGALSWSELLRKWAKHTGGNTEVVGALRSIAAADLRRSTRDADGPDGAGDDAWRLGAWSRHPLSSPEEVKTALQGLTALSPTKLTETERRSVALTSAYALYVLADYDSALSAYGSFDWASDPTEGVVPGDAAVVERVRARAVQGMCYELASRPDTSLALQSYIEAVRLLDKLSVHPLTTPTYLQAPNTPKPPPPAADQRELMRYISTALTRAAVIAAHTSESQLTLRILRTYHAVAAGWPPTFRARQRQRMLNLYLAALFEAFPPAGATVPEPYLLTGGVANRTARATWHAEVAEAFRYGQRLLDNTTSFPEAGKLNAPVIEFANQVSMFPDHEQRLTLDAITVLWWATNLTFQSQLILRRLTCLLPTTGDYAEARRVFELYVETVLKARQAENPESTLALQRQLTIEDGELADNPNDEPIDANGHGESKDPTLYGQMDSDTDFVSTLLVGSRLLLTDLGHAKEAWRYATLAGDVVRQGSVSRKFAALVEENKGVVRLVMSGKDADRVERPKYQAQAINHLRRATMLDPSSARAFYHLAYAEASARSIQPALQAVREALELDDHSVPSWHLLALLLTASGDWEGALKACQTGVALWEADDEALAADDGDLPTVNGHGAAPPHPLLSPEGSLVPPTPARVPPSSRFRRLETVIQLRMTLNVVTEKLHGPDIALEQQQELFLFFSQRTEKGERAERRRSGTISTRVPSMRGSIRATPRGSPVPVSGLSPAEVTVQPPSPPRGSPAQKSPVTPHDYAVEDEPRRLHHKKSLLPKHLHVPSVARANSHSRSASMPSSTLRPDVVPRSRAASATSGSGAPSIAPTAVHSHYAGAGGRGPPPPPLKQVVRRSPEEERVLSDMWLMSAASFRRSGNLEQSLVAIEEAETRDPENPAVWAQLGLWNCAAGKAEDAQAAFTKSLLLRPDYPPGAVGVARLHVEAGAVDLAHSLLSQLVQDRGWDVPEAWFALAKVCERQDRHARARECLLYALQLECTRTCRALPDALPRWSE
ncbi:hypothetical protein CcaverHIS002_0501080 [Cutaneotrichosporon cavernicola]|uniref:TPR-like protein n=1 Tax=Cutaneotrichosporon cavernicola TaxID=279322 RepID=A0AA48L7X6_9TREE|nr:uncharacterized protein CcaverHIS019_0601080 [Cutaneotrichosporon cavernicola]BEI84707.1 hypothetical protein CcaverHIS002_0501080 [Cutaneotrichosporon cavernicola]BEI93649.1 hypothetical protein CcaverHIS019_0601080 [Cutaneotrichosporon cavernicola]BEJ01426.1 hypothetical protein CcaverHIS631_0601080 [Cutaneotrichosporon cavernicola]BEJ09193.1 hypothetical protein CcaverHIS641_0601080 [Cutaneotrichosporon cavernicola]